MPLNWLSPKIPNDASAPTSKGPNISETAHCDESHQAQSYGTTTLHGTSQAILGNVYHTYHHYHGLKDTKHSDHDSHSESDHTDPNLEVSNTINGIPLSSISDYDPEWALWLRRVDRLPGTCQWIFKSKEYRNWESGYAPSTLFCVGPVGCGKSITASAVIDALNLDISSSRNMIIHYFVDTSQNQIPAARDMIRALIKQVVFLSHKNHVCLPSDLRHRLSIVLARTANHFASDTVIQLFKDLTACLMQCIVVIDGLDLLKEGDIVQCLHFLRSITSSASSSQVARKTIVFCRETLGRGIRLENQPGSIMLQISLKHVECDIHHYIDHTISKKQQERTITEDTSLIAEVITVLKANSSRMFLWAKLQVESIWNPDLITNDGSIRQQLQSLPQDLDETYLVCLKRIEETNLASSRDIAPIVFRWIASTGRPLYPAEAQELVSMDYIDEPVTRNDQLLSCPIIDYCANLVVYNHHSGWLEFAHPTVKSFLLEQSKIPAELKHFCLPNMDKLRCGHLCLIYLEQYRNQNQLVVSQKQQVPQNMASPVIRLVSESWPALRWVGRHTEKKREVRNATQLQLPMPSVTRRVLSAQNNAAHHYICNNWLGHTSHIQENHIGYETFNDLCFCHNSEFQPWSETQRKGPDHYRRLAAYAVLSEHSPLLRIAIDQVPRHVFRQPCIGSDSSLLHVAAALGNIEIVRLLLPYGPEYADSEGKSAAAIAAECRQNMLLVVIIEANPKILSFSSPVRQLQTFRPGPPVHENLLNVCAAAGNLEAIRTVLQYFKAPNQLDRYLSAALVKACQKGHVDVAVFLIHSGASLQFVHTELLSPPFISHSSSPLFSQFSGASRTIRTLHYALHTNDLELLNTLLILGYQCTPEIDLPDLFEHFKLSGKTIDPFIASIAFRHGSGVLPYRVRELCWLEVFIKQMTHVGKKAIPFYGRCLRIFLTNLRSEGILHSPRKQVRKIPLEHSNQKDRIGVSHAEIEHWLSIVADDVLIYILRRPLIAEEYLFSPDCLTILANRRTSRALEALLERNAHTHWHDNKPSVLALLGFSHAVIRSNAKYFGPTLNDKAAEPDLHQLFALYVEARKQNRHRRRREPGDQDDKPLVTSSTYLLAKYDIVTAAARCFNHQILEFFACIICPDFTKLMTLMLRPTGNRYIGDYCSEFCEALDIVGWKTYGLDTLQWVRCIILKKGDSFAAAELYSEMTAQGSDMNFALN